MQNAQNPKILVITPDLETGRSLEAQLRVEIFGGWEITGVETIAEAELALRRWNFDMAMIDLSMPGPPRLEILDRLRTLSPGISMVALLGSNREELRSKPVLAGACGAILRESLSRDPAPKQEKDNFLGMIRSALEAPHQGAGHVGVMVLSLDGLVASRGRMGIQEEENLIHDAGQAMRRRLRGSDLFEGLGGPEFGLMLPSLRDPAELLALIPRLEDAAMSLKGHYGMGASVGIALSPGDSREACGLYSRAVVAMKQARLNGGSCAQYYDRELHGQLLEGMRDDVGRRLETAALAPDCGGLAGLVESLKSALFSGKGGASLLLDELRLAGIEVVSSDLMAA